MSQVKAAHMTADRRWTLQAGLIYLLAIAAGALGLGLTGMANEAGPPAAAAGSETGFVLGAILVMVMAAACAGIALSLYPVLKRYNGRLALGAVFFRSVEAVMFLIAGVTLFFLLPSGGAVAEASAVRTLMAYVLGPLAFTAGTILYSVVFFRYRLLPRWLAVWGITAAVAHAAGALLTALAVITPWSPAHIVMNALSLQEIVLALWLTIRGLNTAAKKGFFFK
jgi:hypothetical protein